MTKFIERRKALGITQKNLGKIIGVSQARICSCEKGRSIPGDSLRLRWMQALGIQENPDNDKALLLASLNHYAALLTHEELSCIEGIVKFINNTRK